MTKPKRKVAWLKPNEETERALASFERLSWTELPESHEMVFSAAVANEDIAIAAGFEVTLVLRRHWLTYKLIVEPQKVAVFLSWPESEVERAIVLAAAREISQGFAPDLDNSPKPGAARPRSKARTKRALSTTPLPPARKPK